MLFICCNCQLLQESVSINPGCMCMLQGGDQAEGTCPLCRAELAPAKLFSAAQLQPPAPKDIEEEAAELEAAKGKGDDWALEEERFVSSSKLEAVVRLLEQYRE